MDQPGPLLVTPPCVLDAIAEFEAESDFDEWDLSARIFRAMNGLPLGSQEQKAAWAEHDAFALRRRRRDEQTTRGTVFVTDCVPSSRRFDAAVIDYWRRRMDATLHPVLRARYADLVWDLTKTFTGRPSPDQCARGAIDAYVAASTLADAKTLCVAESRLDRALELALAIADQGRILAARDALVAHQRRFSRWQRWPVLYEKLLRNRRIPVDQEHSDFILEGMEGELIATCETGNGGGSLELKEIALALVKHHKRHNRDAEAQRILRTWGAGVERFAGSTHGMVSLSWLTDLQHPR